jgi:hypothetical protein
LDQIADKTAPVSDGEAPSYLDAAKVVIVGKTSSLGALDALEGVLQERCPELATILQSSAVRTGREVYTRQNLDAMEQQRKLMREATISNVCLMLAGLTSALVLAVPESRGSSAEGWQDYTRLALGIVTLLLGAFAALFAHLARDQNHLGRWLTSRSGAEMARLGIFADISRRAAGDARTAVYGLALIVNHLLSDQRQWLARSNVRHTRSSELTSYWNGIAIALAFVGGSGAVIAGYVKGSAWIAFAGVAAAAASAYATNREALHRDRANVDRYQKLQAALDAIAARVDDIAARISAGDAQALVAFTNAVTEQLSTEHKQWLDGATQAEAVLTKLEAQLDQLGKPKQ